MTRAGDEIISALREVGQRLENLRVPDTFCPTYTDKNGLPGLIPYEELVKILLGATSPYTPEPIITIDPLAWADEANANGDIISREAMFIMLSKMARSRTRENAEMPAKATFKIQMTPDLEKAINQAFQERIKAQEILDAARAKHRAAGIFFIFATIFALWGVIAVAIESGVL